MAAVDQRYARALDAVAQQQGLNAGDLRQQMEDFLASFAGSPQLRGVLEDPSAPQEQKVRVLDAIAGRTGMSGTVRNLLAVMTAHGRLGELRELIDSYLQLADREGGVAEAEITSARPLDDAGRRALESSVAQITGERQVRATYREDPALLGGAVIKVGSTVYDGSVRGQLEQMKRSLTHRAD